MSRVAVVGAGPAGAYAAGQLRASRVRPAVDIFERLPTPWGLLRGGVAPDHQEIKALAETFEAEVIGRGCRFFGGVEVGTDISHADLMERYDAVVYAVGARSDKTLGIPGEELPGSLSATDVVGWYNGHPDLRDLEVDLSARRAVIIGNGNVAADVARIFVRSVDELARTDIADYALEALRTSAIEEVVVLGRRGPAQAAFTSSELYDLGHLDGVDLVVDPAEVDVEPEGTFTQKRNVTLLKEFAGQPATGGRRLVLRFLRSPVSIDGDGRVESITIARNELYRDEQGFLRARTTDETETLDCGLVLRSVGYRAVPIPGVPFDERNFILPNEQGRVAPGVYCVGWIKRGPTGILGTNKRDAQETVDRVVEDLRAGVLPAPPRSDDLDLPDAVTFEGWKAIDAAEVAAGEPDGRPRVKLTSVDELRAATGV
ncbi:MAG: ferredoxin/flavodoxin---NADP+ reductase [Solirubrobacteraceae bacterium]|nr:ferredoxin/flavodoxin---NADP+ reductase [Solirubrobacteraceae bacterium]